MATSSSTIRRGLPRTPGGEPWPPADLGSTVAAVEAPMDAAVEVGARMMRRGLPRTPGGEPWPPAQPAPVIHEPVIHEPGAAAAVLPDTPAAPEPEPAAAPEPAPREGFRPAPVRRPVPPPRPPSRAFARLWELGVAALIFGFLGLILAGVAVIGVRLLLTTPWLQDFLAAYPGEYALPEGTEPGFPAWVQWQHFFNAFLLVLIIKTGIQVRGEKRPSAFWTPPWSKNGRGKVSLTIWFHQSLDILWVLNGVVFVVLLLVSGRWVRVVPTSWEVIPNAISAGLQYVSLDWPVHDGWASYNALQQLMYFITIFIAAPLAIVTGLRMSSFWPRRAERLNRLYPIEWARAVHFPTMLYFVVFILVHVTLVFATGVLRNLNHIYGGTDTESWMGVILFAGSVVITVVVALLARPFLLAPIAALTGKVSGR